ncbi:hypothetical protein GGX14DRAFT_405986 [Mycena pura]|uniref:Uncharacterized protein n=1 Tax=Mycena pura TaxID=153505 RepID=A0AAD6Y025_9AGAR|nr:hypothetical protein GGX14DRAFT_405986 [Mycena pura]
MDREWTGYGPAHGPAHGPTMDLGLIVKRSVGRSTLRSIPRSILNLDASMDRVLHLNGPVNQCQDMSLTKQVRAGVGNLVAVRAVPSSASAGTAPALPAVVTASLFQHIPVLPWSGGVVYNSPASAQVVGLDRRTSPSSISKSLVTAHWSKPPIGVHRSKSPRRRGAIVPFIDDEGASRSGSCASEVPIDDRGKSEVLVDDRGMFGSRPVWVHHYVPWPRSAGVVDQKPLGAEPLIVICPRFTHPVGIERMSVDQLRRFQGVQMQGVRRIPEVERASSSQLEGSVGVGRIIQPVQVKMQVIIVIHTSAHE